MRFLLWWCLLVFLCDTLEIVNSSDDDKGRDWWNEESDEDEDEDDVGEDMEWFFGRISRKEAQKKLLQIGNPPGTFLIRESESRPGDYSLSVRDMEDVKHYRIKTSSTGKFYISTHHSFNTLGDLVDYYRNEDSYGICCQLTNICPKYDAPTTVDLSFSSLKECEIDPSSIHLKRQMGEGQFGEVYEGVWNNVTSVAVKILKPGTMKIEDFLAEAQVMKNMQHEMLIQLYAVCTKGEQVYMVSELMKNGNLRDFLMHGKGKDLVLPQLIDIAEQVASGMAFLEEQNYIHRDLAARNVLVGEGNIIKIADFGLALAIVDIDNLDRQDAKFPIKWTAPEAVIDKKFSIKSDVWSFGVLLYELITYGRVPYPSMTNMEVLRKVKGGYRMPIPPGCPNSLYQIMLDCWNEDPKERPTFEFLKFYLEDYFISTAEEA